MTRHYTQLRINLSLFCERFVRPLDAQWIGVTRPSFLLFWSKLFENVSYLLTFISRRVKLCCNYKDYTIRKQRDNFEKFMPSKFVFITDQTFEVSITRLFYLNVPRALLREQCQELYSHKWFFYLYLLTVILTRGWINRKPGIRLCDEKQNFSS